MIKLKIILLFFILCAGSVVSLAQEEQSMNDILGGATENDTIYKVQFFSSLKYIHKFHNIEERYGTKELINSYKYEGLYRYTYGEYYNDTDPAIKLKEELIELGYDDAFVVAFRGDGTRIFDVVIYKKINFNDL